MTATPSAPTDPTQLVLGGLEVFIFGAVPAPRTGASTSAVFFLHGRHSSARESFAVCQDLHSQLSTLLAPNPAPLVITFDQRNHGTRLVDPARNGAWKDGNTTHAMDMYSLQWGTAVDVSTLIDTLPMALAVDVSAWGVCGISLGGHATLLALANEPRLECGVAIIGCGDYLALMTNRAARMTRKAKTPEEAVLLPPASETAVNRQLLALLKLRDPVNRPEAFGGKAVLLLNGGADKLVPAECNQGFIARVRDLMTPAKAFQEIVEDGIGHETTDTMKASTAQWFAKYLGHKA
ncbi:Alpha/Beta hydrolase protein [Geranomyces variabilis]|nr:Alpha/Beta hydrolase protein [Geranomyces variabilis]KAJ3142269.1 hypothetical protein HDU90_004542 [Geranomyces variabilis]